MDSEKIVPFSNNFDEFLKWRNTAKDGEKMPDKLRTYKDKIDAAYIFMVKLKVAGKTWKFITEEICRSLEVSLSVARQLMHEARNIYLTDGTETKEIYINRTIEEIDMDIAACRILKDYRSITKFVEIKNKMKKIYEQEPVFPAEMFRQPIMIMTSKPQDISPNFKPVAKLIDRFKLSKEDDKRIRIDAGLNIDTNNIEDVTEVR